MTKRPPTPSGEVHPVADLFPMLSDEGLQELADGIKKFGLLEPLVLDDKGMLIDGRNRLAACHLAGVEPTYSVLNGTDPVAFILEKNVKRRNMSTGQRAMVVAQTLKLYEFVELPWGMKAKAARAQDVQAARITEALVVLEYAPELVESVMSGTQFLNAAHTIAAQRKEAQRSTEEHAKREAQELERLQQEAPDLASLVADWSLSLGEALTLLNDRERIERERRLSNVSIFENTTTVLWSLLRHDPAALAQEWVDGHLKKMTVEGLNHLQTGDGLRLLADRLQALADAVDARGGLQ